MIKDRAVTRRRADDLKLAIDSTILDRMTVCTKRGQLQKREKRWYQMANRHLRSMGHRDMPGFRVVNN